MLKKVSWLVVVGLVLIIAALIGGFFWWHWAQQPTQMPTSKQLIIARGEEINQIARRLKKEGLIRSGFAFKLYLLINNLTKEIQAGKFTFQPGTDLEGVVGQLTHGTLDVWVTFPEGWRSEQIAQRLVNNGFDIDKQKWKLAIENSSLEGFLFPDTYLFPRDASEDKIIEIMRSNFDKKVNVKLTGKLGEVGLNISQALVFASILEREAKSAQDRPIVAGILLKRWKKNWPLQADATVQYAIASLECGIGDQDCDWWPKNLTKIDLRVDSPYNTYENKTLPPAPICNPGLASIKAVANYQESSYWFYLSDAWGKMHYAKTLKEHNKNIEKYLR